MTAWTSSHLTSATSADPPLHVALARAGMAATPSVSISHGDEGPPPKELEVITADMETRLRATILRIIRPALDQLADFGARLDSLVAQVARHEEVTLDAEKQKEVISQQRPSLRSCCPIALTSSTLPAAQAGAQHLGEFDRAQIVTRRARGDPQAFARRALRICKPVISGVSGRRRRDCRSSMTRRSKNSWRASAVATERRRGRFGAVPPAPSPAREGGGEGGA